MGKKIKRKRRRAIARLEARIQAYEKASKSSPPGAFTKPGALDTKC